MVKGAASASSHRRSNKASVCYRREVCCAPLLKLPPSKLSYRRYQDESEATNCNTIALLTLEGASCSVMARGKTMRATMNQFKSNNKNKMSPGSSYVEDGRNKLITIQRSIGPMEATRAPQTRAMKATTTNMDHRISTFNRSRNLVGKITNINRQRQFYSNKLAFLAIVTFMTILLLTCLVNQQVSSLNCYTCSSADNPGCDESFTGRSNFTDTDCEKHTGKQVKVCRKIVQYLENKKVVIRSCGWIDEHEEKKPMCYKRSGTFALMMESCICYEDNCNHSASLVPNQSVLILLASGSMIFYYYMGNQRDRSR